MGQFGERISSFIRSVALITAVGLSLLPGATAWALDNDCEIPGYLSDPEISDRRAPHYHPSVSIIVYVRDYGAGTPRGHVTKFITPPGNLGVHTMYSKNRENWIYRQIHKHEDGNALHVEPEPGHVFRFCHLLKLWFFAAKSRLPLSDFDQQKRLTIYFGDELLKDRKLDELLMIPLNNDRKIIILIEEGQMM